MRLLNAEEPATGNFRIEEFGEDEIPQYAILSHTWESEEVSLKDLEGPSIPNKNGYEKIRNCCSLARNAGFKYVWVDTCCIDKTSSMELSEAINSMYRWYQQAGLCYAYLADVPAGRTVPRLPSDCKWFTRGWTLQELIAPSEVIFLNQKWERIGTKSEPSLQQDISNITNIPIGILSGDDDIETASIAQRMSWASKRKTSRLEDRAYCLLGIFDINMPLLYGEGVKAFVRLQEEIIKVSDDQSIFAWRSKGQSHGGLLATCPAAFQESANVVLGHGHSTTNSPWTVNNKGIHLDLSFIGMGPQGLGLAILQCTEREKEDLLIAIYLRDISLTMECFERVWCEEFKLINLGPFRPSQYPSRRICVRQRHPVGRMQLPPLSENMKNRVEIGGSLLAQLTKADIKDKHGRTHLSYVAEDGDHEMVWLLLTRSDVEVHSRDIMGQTPLMHAAKKGHDMVIEMVLARGDVRNHLQDSLGRTPLSHASEGGHTGAVVVFLGRSDMDPDREDNKGRTPLSYDAEGGHQAIIAMLISQGAEFNTKDSLGRTPLSYAAKGGHEAAMAMLIGRGARFNERDGLGRTPLSYAAEGGHEATVMMLINHGAEFNAKDGLGRTPLSHAAKGGHKATVMKLLSKGADVTSNRTGQILLHWAAENGHEEVVTQLLEKGADVNVENESGWTPLAWAAGEGHDAVVEVLLENGADVNVKVKSGLTPLMMAAEKGCKAIVTQLLDHGADANAKTKSGLTPLMWAAKNGHDDTTMQLLGRIDIHVRDNKHGQTPLSWAAARGYVFLVRQLCKMGANIDTRDQSDRTPLDWATREGHQEIVEVLLEYAANSEAKGDSSLTRPSVAESDGHTAVGSLFAEHGADVKSGASSSYKLGYPNWLWKPQLAKLQRRFRSN